MLTEQEKILRVVKEGESAFVDLTNNDPINTQEFIVGVANKLLETNLEFSTINATKLLYALIMHREMGLAYSFPNVIDYDSDLLADYLSQNGVNLSNLEDLLYPQ